MNIRLENTTEELVPALEQSIGPVRAWLDDRIEGAGWRIIPYTNYRKVSIDSREDAAAFILTL